MTPSASSQDSGDYSFTVFKEIEFDRGKLYSSTVNSNNEPILVSDGLQITSQPESQSVALGETANFSVVVAGADPDAINYQWFLNGSPILGATQMALSIPNTDINDRGIYQVRVGSTFDVLFSRTVSLGVTAPPTIIQHPRVGGGSGSHQAEVFVSPGDVYLYLRASGVKDFVWFKGDEQLDLSTSSSIKIPGDILPGIFRVVVSNDAGSVSSLPVNINTLPAPKILSLGTSNPTVKFQGESITISPATEGEIDSHSWTFKGNEISSDASLTLNVIDDADSGSYTYRVSNKSGSSAQSFSLVVNSPLVIEDLFYTKSLSNEQIRPNGLDDPVRISGSDRFLNINYLLTGSTPRFLELTLKDSSDNTQYLGLQDISRLSRTLLTINNPDRYELSGEFSNEFSIQPIGFQPITIIKGEVPELLAIITDKIAENSFSTDIPFLIGQDKYKLSRLGAEILVSTRTAGLSSSAYPIELELQGQGSLSGSTTLVNGTTSRQVFRGVLGQTEAGPFNFVSTSDFGSFTDSVNLLLYKEEGPIDEIKSDTSFQVRGTLGQPLDFGVSFPGEQNLPAGLTAQWSRTTAGGLMQTIPSLTIEQLGYYQLRLFAGGRVVKKIYFNVVPELNPIGFADNFADRGVINIDGGSAGFGVIDNSQASTEDFEPTHQQFGLSQFNSMWSTFTTTQKGGILKLNGNSENFIAIYKDGSTFASLVKIKSDDGRGRLEVRLDPSTTYAIALGNKYRNYSNTRPVLLDWSFSELDKPINILDEPSNAIVNLGESATFTVQTNGDTDPDFNFQWFFNGAPIEGATSPSYTIGNVQNNHIGQYFVRVSSTLSGQVVDSRIVSIQVSVSDIFSASFSFAGAQSQSGGIGAGQSLNQTAKQELLETSVVFSNFGFSKEPGEPDHCDVLGGASVWIPYTPNISGNLILDTNGSLIDTLLAVYSTNVEDPTFDDLEEVACDDDRGVDGKDSQVSLEVNAGATYYIVVDGKLGQVGLITLNLKLVGELDVAIQPLGPITAELGSEITLTAVVDEPLVTPTFQWFQNGQPIEGATADSLIIEDFGITNTGRYNVSATSESISNLSDSVIINVGQAIVNQPDSTTLLEGESANLVVLVDSLGSPTYQWKKDGVDIPEANTNRYQTSDEGQYTVTISDSFGSITSDVATVTKAELLQFVSIPFADQIASIGEPFSLEIGFAGPADSVVQWLKDGQILPNQTVGILAIGSFQPGDAGAYVARISSASGQAIETGEIPVRVVGLPIIIDQPLDQAVALGADIVLTPQLQSDSELSVQWFFDGNEIEGANNNDLVLPSSSFSNDGVYQFTATNLAGTVSSSPIEVAIIGPPIITQEPESVGGRLGGEASFSVLAEGFQPISFQWFKNGDAIDGATTSSLNLNDISADDIGFYSVSISNFGGITQSRNVSLSIETPVEIVLSPESGAFATGSQLRLEVEISGSGNIQYQWLRNGTPIEGANAKQLVINVLKKSDTSLYSVTVSNSTNSVTSDPALIEVIDPPSIVEQSISTKIHEGDDIILFVQADGDGPLTYEWLYNGESIQSGSQRIFQLENVSFFDSGVYQARVSNRVGSVDSSPIEITVVDRLLSNIQYVSGGAQTSGSVLIFFEAFKQKSDIFTEDENINFQYIEPFRTIKTAIELMYESEGHKSLAITSSLPNEGKTFCSVNLANVYAKSGMKTLLVDLDLRNPSLRKFLVVTPGYCFTDILDESLDVPPEMVIQKSDYAFDLAPTTKISNNPSRLLESPNLNKFLKYA